MRPTEHFGRSDAALGLQELLGGTGHVHLGFWLMLCGKYGLSSALQISANPVFYSQLSESMEQTHHNNVWVVSEKCVGGEGGGIEAILQGFRSAVALWPG
jgi:hypothetical protein